MEGDRFCLEKIINWVTMSSLSHAKIDSINCKVSRKDFYQLIVETCFIQCGTPIVIVNQENPELDQSLAEADPAPVFPLLEDTNAQDPVEQQASFGYFC